MKKTLSLILCTAITVVPACAQQAPTSTPPDTQTSATNNTRFVLEDGTPIKLVLAQTISSSDASVGQTVAFEVVEDVLVDGIVVVPKGSNAWATVTAAEHKKTMGRGGKLDMNIDKVRLADGSKTLLSATKNAKGGGHQGAMTGAIVATSLILWPAAPFFLLIHGKDITIPKGTAITAFVQGDDTLDRGKFLHPAAISAQTAPAAAPSPAPAQQPVSSPPVQPAFQAQSTDQQPSLGEVARQNRARKAQEAQAQTQTQDQNPPRQQ
jgi:hypothetical protein